jgi:hypothetical protein
MRTNNVDCFLHASTARHDIFDDDEALVFDDFETAAQDEFAILLFDKNMAFAKRASDFLPDDESAESRGDDRIAIEFAQFVGEPCTNFCGNVGMLEQQRALKILATVQTGAQDEVAIKQCAGFAKKRDQIFAHRCCMAFL